MPVVYRAEHVLCVGLDLSEDSCEFLDSTSMLTYFLCVICCSHTVMLITLSVWTASWCCSSLCSFHNHGQEWWAFGTWVICCECLNVGGHWLSFWVTVLCRAICTVTELCDKVAYRQTERERSVYSHTELTASFTGLLYTRAISEHFRDHLGIIKRYTNGLFTLLTLLYLTFPLVIDTESIMNNVGCVGALLLNNSLINNMLC